MGAPCPGRWLDAGGYEGVYHQNSCVKLILGFSIVGNSRMIFIFIFGYLTLPQGRFLEGAGWGARGGIPPKIMFYVNSWVFNSAESKNELHYHFRVPLTPARAPLGERAWGLEGGSPVLPKIMCQVNLGFSIVGNLKMIFIFILGYPQPLRGFHNI